MIKILLTLGCIVIATNFIPSAFAKTAPDKLLILDYSKGIELVINDTAFVDQVWKSYSPMGWLIGSFEDRKDMIEGLSKYGFQFLWSDNHGHMPVNYYYVSDEFPDAPAKESFLVFPSDDPRYVSKPDQTFNDLIHMAYLSGHEQSNQDTSIFASNSIQKISIAKITESVGASKVSTPQLLDWSSDGQFVLFAYDDYTETLGGVNYIGLMTPDMTEVKKLDLPIELEDIIQTRFSPSNDYILIGASYDEDEIRYADLFIYSINDNKLTKITDAAKPNLFYNGPGLADWTPDGNIIQIEGDQSDRVTNIWLIDREGNKLNKLFSGNQLIGDMDVSSDGKKIVFVQGFESNMGLGIFDIDAKEFKTILTTSEPFIEMESPRWSPNDEFVLYHVHDGHGGALKIASIDGTLQEDLVADNMSFAYSSYVISPDGRFMLFNPPEFPPEIYKMELARPIPEFSVDLLAITALGLIGILIAVRMKDEKLFLR